MFEAMPQPDSIGPQPDSIGPLTSAVKRAVADRRSATLLSDLLFLERWEIAPIPGTAAALRVSQIRRANPDLVAAVQAELAAARRSRIG